MPLRAEGKHSAACRAAYREKHPVRADDSAKSAKVRKDSDNFWTEENKARLRAGKIKGKFIGNYPIANRDDLREAYIKNIDRSARRVEPNIQAELEKYAEEMGWQSAIPMG